MSINSTGRTPGVDSARRALRVLLYFGDSQRELTAEEIATEVGISLPSVYRFLSLLKELNLIENSSENKYCLTPRSLILADSAERFMDTSPVLTPIVRKLTSELGEAALAIHRLGDYATCAELSQVNHSVTISMQPGAVLSLHRGAGAKVLLASMGDSWLDGYIQRVLPDAPKAELEALRADMERVRNQGWATSSAEIDEGVWAAAAPVHIGGRVVASLSVAGPRYRINEESKEKILKAVVAHAKNASDALAKQLHA